MRDICERCGGWTKKDWYPPFLPFTHLLPIFFLRLELFECVFHHCWHHNWITIILRLQQWKRCRSCSCSCSCGGGGGGGCSCCGYSRRRACSCTGWDCCASACIIMRYEKNVNWSISFLSSSLSVVEEKNCPRVNMEAAEILPLLAEGKSASETRWPTLPFE